MNIPKHLAFIMDGNGRWAQMRGLPRKVGHKKGLETVHVILDYCLSLKIEVVSLYVFSTENWNRPQSEIDELFSLAKNYVDKFADFCQKGIRIVISGEKERLPKQLLDSMDSVVEKTKLNSNMTVNLCINYGGRNEIVHAVNKMLESNITRISESDFSKYLYNDLPYPDLIVRTGGQMRLSNFLLYQSAYSELYFSDTLWPDYSTKDIDVAIDVYNKRVRNFGGLQSKC